MLESIASALSAIKQTTPALLLGIAVASLALLFLPANVTDVLGVAGLLKAYRPQIGIALIASLALLTAQGLVSASSWIKSLVVESKKKKAREKNQKLRQEALHKLTPDEKGYLYAYIADEQNTQYFGVDDGVAGGLQAKSIIYRATNIGDMRTGFPFNIHPWAREYLTANPHLLEGARFPQRRSRW